MRGQVEVGAVRHTFQLTPRVALETELVLDVDGAIGIVRQLLLRVFEEPQVFRVDAEVDIPLQAGVDPVLMPLLGGRRLDEELHLHLLELAGTEDEVARRDLVAEALTDLPDAERRLAPRGRDHVGEVDEDALRGLGAQVVHAILSLDRPEVGLEHHVEVARFGPLPLGAAVRADDLAHRHVIGVAALLRGVRLLHVVLAVPLVAVQALDQRVVEHLDVAGGHPHLSRQNDRRVQPHHVVAAGDHRAPPLPLDVLLELDAQWTVVPGRLGAAVDLTRGKDEAAPFGQVDYGVDDGRHRDVHFLPGLRPGARQWTAAPKTSVIVAIAGTVFDMHHHACDSGSQPNLSEQRVMTSHGYLLAVLDADRRRRIIS